MEALDQDSAPKELFYTEGPPTLRDARLQACALGPRRALSLYLLLHSRPPRPRSIVGAHIHWRPACRVPGVACAGHARPYQIP